MRPRRLIGPTVISLALCALLADHLFLSQSRWSASRFLGKLIGTFSTIVAPPASPGFSSWPGDIFLPFSVIALALALLCLMFAGAKRAMRQATPR